MFLMKKKYLSELSMRDWHENEKLFHNYLHAKCAIDVIILQSN